MPVQYEEIIDFWQVRCGKGKASPKKIQAQRKSKPKENPRRTSIERW